MTPPPRFNDSNSFVRFDFGGGPDGGGVNVTGRFLNSNAARGGVIGALGGSGVVVRVAAVAPAVGGVTLRCTKSSAPVEAPRNNGAGGCTSSGGDHAHLIANVGFLTDTPAHVRCCCCCC